MKNFNHAFYVKKEKINSQGQVPIYARIVTNGTKTTFATGYWVDHQKWAQNNQLRTARGSDSIRLREDLNQIKIELEQKAKLILEAEMDLTADTLKDAYLLKKNFLKQKSKTFMEAFDYHNEKFIEQIKAGKKNKHSLTKFRTTQTHLKAFIRFRYKKEDISLDKLNFEFIERFDLFLQNEKNIGNNTAVKYVQTTRKITNDALKYGWMTKDPFAQYTGRLEEIDTVYLDEQELLRIEQKVFSSERLNIVKDIFLFSCYTSYAPCDVAKLTSNDVVKHFDGQYWIFTKRLKTKIESNVMLIPPALRIIAKYKNHPLCVVKNSLLPKRSNQKVNEYLKEIADICGITKTLHHYVARHTFATTVMMANGVPLETISKMMGHKRITQTQHYARLVNSKVSEDMMRLKDILEKKEQANNSISTTI
jgi:site-specific recombinase XerD